MDYKTIDLAIKSIDEQTGTIEGYGAWFGNVDDYGDVIMPGAFTKSLATRMPKMLFAHDTTQPIGVWDEAKEDAHGLYLKGRFSNTAQGQDVRALVQMRALDSMSIGYRTVDAEYNGSTRILKELDLREVSIVSIPANEKAVVTSAKSASEQNGLIEAFKARIDLLTK